MMHEGANDHQQSQGYQKHENEEETNPNPPGIMMLKQEIGQDIQQKQPIMALQKQNLMEQNNGLMY